MKKIFLSVLLTLSAFSLFAEPYFQVRPLKYNGVFTGEKTCFQLGLLPERYVQLYTGNVPVYGAAFGIFVLEQQSAPFSFGIGNGLKYNYGFQLGVVNVTENNVGFSCGPLVSLCSRNYGLSFGVFNIEGDFGIVDESQKEGSKGCQLGVFNIGGGWQFGVLNYNPHSPFLKWCLLFNWPESKD